MYISIFVLFFLCWTHVTHSACQRVNVSISNLTENTVAIGVNEGSYYVKSIAQLSKKKMSLKKKVQQLSFAPLPHEKEIRIYEVEPQQGSVIIIFFHDIIFRNCKSVKRIE